MKGKPRAQASSSRTGTGTSTGRSSARAGEGTTTGQASTRADASRDVAKTSAMRKHSTASRAGTGKPAASGADKPSASSAAASGTAFLAGKGKLIAACAAVIVVLAAVIAFAIGQLGARPEEDAAQGAGGAGGAGGQQWTRAAGPYSISFASTGDLIFWREVADYIDKNGGASAMANIADYLAQADITIANVESPLSDDESDPIPDKDVYIIGRPSAIESIKNSDITFASLANNHIMDYGKPALKDTLEALDGAGVLHAGAGLTEEDASKLAETTVDGVSVAFLSWTDIVPDNFLAYKDEPGVVSARMDMADALKRVREAKETHDIVVVAMHWGVEYQDYITDYLQSEPAHQLVDAGADIIIGNHPHVIEGIEFYNGALIAYAQGNCVFWQKYDHTHESYILNFDMTEEGVKNVVVTPLYLDDKYGIPSIAEGKQATETLERLEEISEDMNTAFNIRDGKAYVTPIEASKQSASS